MYDYTEAQPQRELIPAGTVATLQLIIQPAGAGEGGLLRRSQDGLCEMLQCEFIVVDGQFAKSKFWQRFVLSGHTEGHAKAADISRSKLRAILESARGIKPADLGPQARAARNANIADFDGIRFIGKIGIEKGGNYPDRNVLLTVVTPDRKDWHIVEQVPPPPRSPDATSNASAPAAISKPAWAS